MKVRDERGFLLCLPSAVRPETAFALPGLHPQPGQKTPPTQRRTGPGRCVPDTETGVSSLGDAAVCARVPQQGGGPAVRTRLAARPHHQVCARWGEGQTGPWEDAGTPVGGVAVAGGPQLLPAHVSHGAVLQR